jgi:hypothetical protein
MARTPAADWQVIRQALTGWHLYRVVARAGRDYVKKILKLCNIYLVCNAMIINVLKFI